MGLEKINVHKIYQSTAGHIWVLSDTGLFQFRDNEWVEHFKNEDQKRAFKAILEKPNGDILVGDDNGLFSYSGSKWQQKLFVPVNCIYMTSDGILMVGSVSGLFVFSQEEISRKKTALNGIYVAGVHQAPDGKMWLNSHESISYFDGIEWVHFTEGIYSTARGKMVSARDGKVWFSRNAYSTGGLYVYDGRKVFQVENYNRPQYDIMESSDGRIWSIGGGLPPVSYDGQKWTEHKENWPDGEIGSWAVGEDANGDIWVGSAGGLLHFDRQRWEQVLTQAEAGNIQTLYLSSDGTFWAGSWGRGIFKQEKNGSWMHVWKSGSVWSFHEASNGQLFAVLMVGGLLQWDGKIWAQHPSFDTADQYNDRTGTGFVEQPEGIYWLATKKGLMRIEADFWYFLTMSDGLPSNAVNSVAKDSEGNIWVGTKFGAYMVENKQYPHPPAVEITEIDDSFPSRGSAYETGRSFVSITWAGGDIQTPAERMVYQYKSLDPDEGVDVWSSLIRQNTVTIGLPNGRHHFSVRAIDHHFNVSPVDSITIIVKTEAPNLSIQSPIDGDIVSGEFYIKGKIKDDDFAAFQVFLSDLALTETPVVEDDSEANLQKPYQLIFNAEGLPRTGTLAKLDTKSLDDGDYQIWLTAQDQLQHSSFDKIIFRVDNTAPKAKVLTPKVDDRVLKQVFIWASVSDIHLDSYRFEFSTDSEGKSWEQIYLQAGLYQETEDELLRKPELQTIKIDKDWEIPILEGSVWIRLTATDIAGNTSSQTIRVEVPTAVVTRKGGTIAPEDQQAELYFPPNTLAQDEVVTVNALTETEVEPPVRRVSQIYDFAPATLRLNSIKPATLTISYDSSQLSAGKEPVIFHRTDGAWKAVGGTPNLEQQTISAAVLSLGQYTLGEMDEIEALDSANLKPDSLTCQPRVFSPTGNSFSTHTTISFTLDLPANVTIKVYNVAGQLVEWMAQQQTFGSGKQAIRWSGRDSDGEVVTTGLYIVTVTVGGQTQDKVVNVWNH